MPTQQIIYNFGRADQVDRDAMIRLCTSLAKVCGIEVKVPSQKKEQNNSHAIGLPDVRTSPYYPQSNGKIERWHRSLKQESIRPKTPLSLNDARRLVSDYVAHYNGTRLHNAIGYVTPLTKLEGMEEKIFKERDRKLESAREKRKANESIP